MSFCLKGSALVWCLFFLISDDAMPQDGWQPQNATVEETLGLHDVFFVDEAYGWAYAYGTGKLIHTQNGGKQWQELHRFPGHEEDYFFEQVQFANRRDGWIVGDFGYVYRTSDGGKTWIDISPEIEDRRKVNLSPDEEGGSLRVLYYGLHSFSKDRALVSGMSYVPGNRRSAKFLLWHTTNAGKDWKLVENSPKTMFFTFKFVTDRTGFAAGGNTLYRTDDGGMTWREIFKDAAKTVGQIRGLDSLDGDTIMACGFGGAVVTSTDGGKTWSQVKVGDNRLRSLVLLDAKRAYVVGDQILRKGCLYKTLDGGRTWTAVAAADVDLHRITKTDEQLFAVGKSATILKKTIGKP